MKQSYFIPVFAVVLLLGLVAPAFTQTAYISEIIKITLRTGPGTDYKVISMIPSGQQLEVLNTNHNWTQVRLPDGKEGWVLSRFITLKEPCVLLLSKLQAERDLADRNDHSLAQQNRELTEQLNALQTTLFERQSALKKLQQENARLEKAAKVSPEINAAHRQTRLELEKAQKEISLLQKKTKPKFFTTEIKWFLIGSGVFLAGLLIGLLTKERKRKSTFLT